MATAAKKWKSATAPFPEAADADTGPDGPAPYVPDVDDDEDAVLNFDIAGASDSGGQFDVIAPGTHLAFIRSIDQERSKKGNKQLKIVFEVADGTEEGKARPTYIGLDPKFAWKIKQLLTAINIPPDEMNKMTVGKIKEAALETMVSIQVKSDTWTVTNSETGEVEHRPSCNIDRINDPSAFGVAPGTKVS